MSNMHATPPELQEMLMDYYTKQGRKKYLSDFWIWLNNIHIAELLVHGYDNFKHTIASNYFTWLGPVDFEDIASQISFLTNNLSGEEITFARKVALKFPFFPYANKEFNTTTLMLWQYTKNQGLEREVSQLSEPMEDSPPAINFEGRLISQDIANSLLEWDTIQKAIEPGSVKTILEIGAGYGRSTFVWLTLEKVQKYVIVDIPPALYISQRYLSSQFQTKKVFKYRDFKSFGEIKNEYEQAELVFLLPWQIELLPKKSFDLIFAIDCLDEMRFDIIKFYFEIVNILAKKYFYMKCYKEYNGKEGIIKQGDYPVPAEWECLVDRECRVQTKYFESLYKLP